MTKELFRDEHDVFKTMCFIGVPFQHTFRNLMILFLFDYFTCMRRGVAMQLVPVAIRISAGPSLEGPSGCEA